MKKQITFIDLFAGIGGFHLALESLGAKCVFASEIDDAARKTYIHNFSKSSPELFQQHLFNQDIRNLHYQDIPDFDILCAGFPCQPFSQAGYKQGFEDTQERGNLFYVIADIIQEKKPAAILLENVRHLVNHDKGNTFKTIRHILEDELNYSFHYKVMKASDFGLPQHRPRVFIVGFKDETILSQFDFPQPIPLEMTMSDIWGGECNKDIGFTLRVGGKGSAIDDRRNWDGYLVDGEEKRISPKEAKKMQGFPDDFEFPVSRTQAMKQLGNSVAVPVVKHIAAEIVEYLQKKQSIQNANVEKKLNKGEWSELYTFLKILNDNKLHLANTDLTLKPEAFTVQQIVSSQNQRAYMLDGQTVSIENTESNQEIKAIDNVKELVDINELLQLIKAAKGSSFALEAYQVASNELGYKVTKAGSLEKSDIHLQIYHPELFPISQLQGFSIKSMLGMPSTLFNASSSTNVTYCIEDFSGDIEQVNQIKTRYKIRDRLQAITENCQKIAYAETEKPIFKQNLKKVDSAMDMIVAEMLLIFYSGKAKTIKDIYMELLHSPNLATMGFNSELLLLKLKKLLLAIALGLFPTQAWSGFYSANGCIVVKEDGKLATFHIIDEASFADYLFENTKLDTPSSSRNRFGMLYQQGKQHYFKLNLQIRFIHF